MFYQSAIRNLQSADSFADLLTFLLPFPILSRMSLSKAKFPHLSSAFCHLSSDICPLSSGCSILKKKGVRLSAKSHLILAKIIALQLRHQWLQNVANHCCSKQIVHFPVSVSTYLIKIILKLLQTQI